MKKSILSAMFIATGIVFQAFAMDAASVQHRSKTDTAGVRPIKTFQDIITDANVVMVVSDDSHFSLRIEGEKGLLRYVQIKEQEGSLRIVMARPSTIINAPMNLEIVTSGNGQLAENSHMEFFYHKPFRKR